MAVSPSRCFGISYLGCGRETLVMMQNHLVTGKNHLVKMKYVCILDTQKNLGKLLLAAFRVSSELFIAG